MSRPIARPKRFADQFDGPSHLTEAVASQASKKARTQFSLSNPSTLAADDDADEDAILELDEIGRKGTQTKRNAVELDGYESDSSQENFDARADARAAGGDGNGNGGKKGKGKSKDEEANDMFADLEEDLADGDEDEEGAGEGKKKKKAVRFMEANEIEGQVSNSKSGGHVSADFTLNSKQVDKGHESSSDEGDDEVRDMLPEDIDEELGAGAKKTHAPKLDAFNMQNEQEEGRFDENGNFVRKAADPFALHDAWLEGASNKADMKKAQEAEAKREQDRRRREREDDAISTSALLGRLISRLEHGETSLEALARLAAKKDKKKPKWQKKKKKVNDVNEMDVDQEPAKEDAAETKRKEAVEDITAAADGLLTRGQTEIYSFERAVLMRQYKREAGEDWVDQKSNQDGHTGNDDGTKQWEYRWADGRDGGEYHGPYDGPTMTAWNGAGYFGEGVEFRQIGTDEWNASVDF